MQVNQAETAVALAPDAATKSAAAAALVAAQAQLAAAQAKWEADIAAAEEVKASLGGQVSLHAAEISAQARKAFEENPGFLGGTWQAIKDFMHDNADLLSVVSDALQIIGGIMMLIPGLQILGAVLVGIGVGLKFLLAAAGEASWGEFLFDLATCGALGALGKLAKTGKLGSKVAALQQSAVALKESAGKAAARGIDRILFALDPVDIATGAMVDSDTDIRIEGTLPLVIDRHAFSTHEVGRALGPRWISRMDVRLEVAADVVTMLCPDGALIQFPPAPVDGSEVRGNGRGWLLSFGDGAYRVRAVNEAVTYHFHVYEQDDLRPDGVGVAHGPASVGRSMVGAGIVSGSVAERFGISIELGISSMVHRTGQRIDYVWDNATGHMVAMVRSDGTRLDLSWDGAINRVSGVWVSNPLTHPDDDPVRLVSYGYDPFGRLITVRNSHAGVLRYRYDEQGRPCGWTDRNGVSYVYRFDEAGRVSSQVGTGGFFPNTAVWLDDTAEDAPAGGIVVVAIETATPFEQDPLAVGDSVMDEFLDRLDQLELVAALREGGLVQAGLTGRGRAGVRDEDGWSVPDAWLHDEVLGDVRPTVYRCSADGDVWRIITPEGRVTDFEHNSYHQVTKIVDSAGEVWSMTYNEDGVCVGEGFPDGTSRRVEPGAWGVPARIIERDGSITECDVDAFGMVTALREPSGAETKWDWQVRASGIVLSSVTDPGGYTTVMEHDDAGRLMATVDPAGRRMSWVRDVCGRVIEAMDPNGAVTMIGYTPEGWANEVVFEDGARQSATFDGEGNQLSFTNELGLTSTVQYTVFDQPALTTDADGAVTRITYNTQMQPVAVTNADNRTWRYEYNLDGTIAREIDYNGRPVTASTSVDGLRTVVESPAGTTTLERNWMGNVERVVDSSGVSEFAYDLAGRVTGVSNAFSSVSYTYDADGQIAGETVTLASGESTGYEAHVDAAGQAYGYSILLPAGERIYTEFARDGYGQIATSDVMWEGSGNEGARTLVGLSYSRDQRGLRDTIDIGALTRSFSYDQRARRIQDRMSMSGASVGGAAQSVAGRELTWRADTKITEVRDQLRGRSLYSVDEVGRVTAVRRESSAANPQKVSHGIYPDGAGQESYEYSPAGVLNRYDAPQPEESWQKPALRTSAAKEKIEFSGTMPTRVGRTTYIYDGAGRVVRTVTKRISKKPLVKNFYYATGEQPIGFDSSDTPGMGWRYIYDGLGRRVAKETINTETGEVIARTVFAHAGDQLVGEYTTMGPDAGCGWVVSTDPETGELVGQVAFSPSSPSASVEDDPAQWSQQRVDAEFYALMADLAGAPQEIIDPRTGEVLGCAVHTLYGQRRWRGTLSMPLLFAGQYVDQESGWAYNRFRFYDPKAGIYNAQDPLGVAAQLSSAQGYVAHPVLWCDPFGLKQYSQVANPALQARIDALTSNQKGQVGEKIAREMFEGRFLRDDPRGDKYVVNGRTYIPDLTLTSDQIVEVKFVKKLDLRRQIRDGLAHAGPGT
ncbi:DUF6531 domain-containing protein [Corynebacterium mayonis]|uniref:DUF6531 domain-containing protein n=1 Tax=Corynebacterium mayonis TaxID=3062461 RepID=UPI003140448D